ncbi:MAG: hypothetical protein EAX96_18190 [Candidatus Lokiarchaeota archaeon]|nr:hypothetical protein [Candidatus Lokiarchaeota archaeon]
MSKRSELKDQRRKRQETKSHIQQTIVICTAIAIALIIIIISFLISIYFREGLTYDIFFRNIYEFLSSFDIGLITGFSLFISFMLIIFYFFVIIAIANYREYQREVAGWWEIIITASGTVALSSLFDLVLFIPLALTLVGCIVVTFLLYIIQTPSEVE